ncbi:MAG: hypothetical protein DRN03_06705 [Thermoplasmata archaeon]|nr:MAG: hypothetical protein DRN03_06705 [Thermoplasmata archaeon]
MKDIIQKVEIAKKKKERKIFPLSSKPSKKPRKEMDSHFKASFILISLKKSMFTQWKTGLIILPKEF